MGKAETRGERAESALEILVQKDTGESEFKVTSSINGTDYHRTLERPTLRQREVLRSGARSDYTKHIADLLKLSKNIAVATNQLRGTGQSGAYAKRPINHRAQLNSSLFLFCLEAFFDFAFDVAVKSGIGLEQFLCSIPPLGKLSAVVAKPRASFLNNFHFEGQIKQ